VFYFVSRNAQGDVVSIYNSSNSTLVGTYTYDAWGRPIDPATGKISPASYPNGTSANDYLGVSLASTTSDPNGIMVKNPFRYRGYYFDRETSFYYLQSRYYDSESKRWINPDPIMDTGLFDENSGKSVYNVFVYCANNPVNYSDPSGNVIISTLVICIIVGALAGGTVGGIAGNEIANKNDVPKEDKWKYVVGGALIGAVCGGAVGALVAPVIVSATGVAGISVSSAGITTIAASSGYGALSTASQYGPSLYEELTRTLKGTGLQAHHILENRFGLSNISVALTPAEHQVFTNHWRQLLPYGNSYTVDQIWAAAQKVYANYPALLEEARRALGK